MPNPENNKVEYCEELRLNGHETARRVPPLKGGGSQRPRLPRRYFLSRWEQRCVTAIWECRDQTHSHDRSAFATGPTFCGLHHRDHDETPAASSDAASSDSTSQCFQNGDIGRVFCCQSNNPVRNHRHERSMLSPAIGERLHCFRLAQGCAGTIRFGRWASSRGLPWRGGYSLRPSTGGAAIILRGKLQQRRLVYDPPRAVLIKTIAFIFSNSADHQSELPR